jgi:heparinase II/III-like protein
MNARALIGRVAAMDAGELRFRVVCEARKAAGRVRFAVAPPVWRRRDLVRLLDADAGPLVRAARRAAAQGDYLAAHRALARHVETRAARWPIAAVRRSGLTAQLHARFPAAAAEAAGRADRIIQGRYDLLGYRDLPLGSPPDWQNDAVHRRPAPPGFWSAIPFLDPASGDHKVIWEVNRHQHFLCLGAASWLTGCPTYRDTFVAHLEHWLRANPPLSGINWASMLELGFRALSWTWAVEFFAAGGDADEVPWLVDLLVALDRQLEHVAHNLSTYFSPNTHILGEALALYAVSQAFPELRSSAGRAAAGRTILQREARAQLKGDGGHVELSSHYHRYSTDFYLLAHLVARETGDGALFDGPLRAQARYLRTIADDGGRLPHTGDEDGGQLFRFGATAPDDASPTLAVAAAVLDDASLAVAAPTVDACWILGREPRGVTTPAAAWPSHILADTGYVVLRRHHPTGYLLFDAGPHGFLNGGHAHADALSVVVTAAGRPVFVDAGTPTYTMDAAARDRFRAPAMHNTITIDGEPFARPHGPFHWHSYADAQLLAARVDESGGFAAGMHTGYGFPVVRLVATIDGAGWLIVDYATLPRDARVEAAWHLHPSWSAAGAPGGFLLTHASGPRLALATTATTRHVATGEPWSPEYGRIEPATVLRTAERGTGPTVVGHFVPLQLQADEIPVITLAGTAVGPDGWTWYSFSIAGDAAMEVTIGLPQDPRQPIRQDWPQPCIRERRAICVE